MSEATTGNLNSANSLVPVGSLVPLLTKRISHHHSYPCFSRGRKAFCKDHSYLISSAQSNRLKECKGAEQHWMGVMMMTKEMMHTLDKTGCAWVCVCVFPGSKNDDVYFWVGFPGGSVVKNPPANAGDVGSIPGLGRSPGERIGNPLQYSCLTNPMDKRSLVGYSPWGCKRVVHDLATK